MAYDFEVEGIYYSITSETDLTCEVVYYYYSGDIAIPSSVKNNSKTYSVTSIGDYAFNGCNGLTSVSIPNSVTSIGSYAFSYCSGLTSVTIPSSVTSIGSEAFIYCSNLTSVTIPNSVTSIEYKAFSHCSGLTSVTIPNSVTSIGNCAFEGCSGLTSVTIPNSVTSIGIYVFYGCSLSTIKVEGNSYYDSRDDCNAIIETASNTLIVGCNNTIIPNSVTSIGAYAFEGCSGLTSVTIPNSVTSIGDRTFYGCSGLTSVSIPNSVTSIGSEAFEGCSGLTSVTIPNSVTSIESAAFYGCSGLTSVTIPNSVTNIGMSAFSGCSRLTSVTIPNSVTSIESSAFYGCSGLTSVTIPNSVTSIGIYAFYGCSGLTSVTIPNSVTSIGSYAFSGCSGLTSVTIPNSVTSIEYCAFEGCSGLTSVTIPNSVTIIGPYAFSKCTDLKKVIINDIAAWCGICFVDSLSNPLSYSHHLFSDENTEITEIIIPNSVTSIGQYAFYGCDGLTSVTIPNSVTSIEYCAFYSCDKLTSVTINSDAVMSNYNLKNEFGAQVKSYAIGDSVKSVVNKAFYGCSGLTSVTIGNSVTSIGNNAFEGCSGLTSVTIGNSVTSIGMSAFSGCSRLTSVTIPNSVTSIEYGAFQGCSGLTSVTIPNSVTRIGMSAFSGCSGLTSVTIPNSVTSIQYGAFQGCSGLTSVTIPNSVTSIGISAFRDCCGLTSVTIPNSVTFIESSTFYGCSGLTSVTIGNSVTSIVSEAFYGCSGLTSVTIPNSVTSIQYGAFQGCSGLTSVTIPNSVTSIGDDAFNGCNSIKDCVFGCSSTLADKYIPKDNIQNITLMDDVVDFSDYSFSECSKLDTLVTLASTPPILLASKFSNAQMSDLKVGVPAISRAAYHMANVWKDFTHIYNNEGYISIKLSVKDTVMVYGDSVPAFEFVSEGEGASEIVWKTEPTITCSAKSDSPVGEYDIEISGGEADGFVFTYEPGVLTIKKAPLTIAAGNYTKKQGEANPEFGLTYTGFKNNETEAALTKKPTVTCEAVASSVPGEYSVKVTGAEAQNYEISYTNGKLTVTEADPVTITAKNYTRAYGDANPTFEFTSEGVALEGTPVITCEATATSPVGTYDIVVTQGDVKNYNVKYVKGTLSITKAPLKVSVGDYTRRQGSENPTFELAYEGFKNNETETVLKKLPVVTCAANETSHSGVYDIVISGGEAQNYEFSYENGTLTVVQSDNELYASAVTGMSNTTVVLPIGLKNKDVVTGVQFYLDLPDGVTVSKAEVASRASKMSLSYNLSDGVYKFAVLSMGGNAFEDNDGAIAEVTLKVAESVEEGDHTIRIAGVRLSPDKGESYVAWDATAVLAIDNTGDATGNGAIDIADAVAVVNHIVGKSNKKFKESYADVTDNGIVDVTDAVGIVKFVARKISSFSELSAAKAKGEIFWWNDYLAFETSSENVIGVALTNAESYTAFQCEVNVPVGVEVKNIVMNTKRSQGHTLIYNKVSEGKYAVVGISFDGSTFRGNEGALFSIETEGNGIGEYSIEDIRFVNENNATILMDRICVPVAPTGIKDVYTSEDETSAFDMNGRRVDASHQGIQIKDGQKVIIK